ncbi:MAG TPA: hypothetical protein VHF47_14525 [Acidimicrobiales bacterium]|nr:hypothetical protein [Acidimicrobiales bacterium]
MNAAHKSFSSADFTTALTVLSHQAVLSELGWRDAFDRQAVVDALYGLGGEVVESKIAARILSIYHVEVDQFRVHKALRGLEGEGIVRRGGGGRYRLTEEAREQATAERRDAEERLRGARSKFDAAARQHCPEIPADDLWNAFLHLFLARLVEALGAKTINFLLGGAVDVAGCAFLKDLLSAFPAGSRPGIEAALVRFLDPGDEHVTSLVFDSLTRRYLVEAANLAPAQLDLLLRVLEQRPVFRVFCDTNLVLAALGMQDPLKNEVASSLLRLRSRLVGRVELQLFILPVTITETLKAMAAAKGQLKRKEAGSDEQLSSLAKAAVQAVTRPGGPRTTDAFFDGPATTLLQRLRDLGIELYNEDTTSLTADPEVIRIVQEWEDRPDGRNGLADDDSAKLLRDQHDATLLVFTRRKRPPAPTVATAGWWTGTFDSALLRYDAARTEQYDLVVAVSPSTLVRLLGFWAPRSDELEKALVSSVRQLFPQLLHMDPLGTSTEILDAIEEYEAADGTPTSTLALVSQRVLDAHMREDDAEGPATAERLPDTVVEALTDARSRLSEQVEALTRALQQSERERRQLKDQLAVVVASAALTAATAERNRQAAEAAEVAQAQAAAALAAVVAAEQGRQGRWFYRVTVPVTTLATSALTGAGALVADAVVEPHPAALVGTGAVGWSYVTLYILQQKALANPGVHGRFWESQLLTRVLGGLRFVGKELVQPLLKKMWDPSKASKPADPPSPPSA